MGFSYLAVDCYYDVLVQSILFFLRIICYKIIMMPSRQENSSIISETVAALETELGPDLRGLMVDRAVIGLFFSGVKLSDGSCGICFTPIKEIPESVCCPSSAAAMPNAGRLSRVSVTDYVKYLQQGRPLKAALGIAVLNALSQTCWRENPSRGYTILPIHDTLDDLDIPDEAYVVVVGALVPYLRMLKKRGRPFGILEKDVRTLKEDELPFFIEPEETMTAIGRADRMIITGTTLLNGALEGILKAAKPEAEIAVVGPTASMLPDAFFRRGVTVLGGVECTDADLLLDTLAEGGSGYHFFGKSARRIVIRKS